MHFVIVFTEKVNVGSMEASSNVGEKASSLECALEIGRSKDTSDVTFNVVHNCWGPRYSEFEINLKLGQKASYKQNDLVRYRLTLYSLLITSFH